MRVFIDLQNGQVPLSHQEYNRNRSLVTSQTNTDVGVAGVEQHLSVLVHFKEKETCLNEEAFLVCLCDLLVFFVRRNDLTRAIICIIT